MKKLISILILLMPGAIMGQSTTQRQNTGTHVDQMPIYPGGLKALTALFIDSIDQPKVQWEDRDESDDHPEITLALTIDVQGKVTNVKVLKSINPKTDARCVNLARKLKFKPAMYNGKPVKVVYTLPLKFDMEF